MDRRSIQKDDEDELSNAGAHREPPRCALSVSVGTATWRRCGYSRWENRSSHLCCKTVRASFPAHGSSVLRLLSRVPHRACALFFPTCAACDAPPYVSPSPRQPIREL